MTNWKAMQVPMDKDKKKPAPPVGVRTRYLSMGSWHAMSSKGGQMRPGVLKKSGSKD